jgi:micrococcal nuclease
VRRPSPIAPLLLIAFGCAFVFASCSGPATTHLQPPLATVVRVIDGDTLVADIAGSAEAIRLIGIDTPEVAHHDEPGECFGAEASAYLTALLPPGSTVTLLRDSEARDRYGRLLAYVRVGDIMVNVAIVEQGFAETLSIAPNTSLAAQFSQAQREAKAAGRGLWTACQ